MLSYPNNILGLITGVCSLDQGPRLLDRVTSPDLSLIGHGFGD